eukprot:gene23121-29959_t
MHAIAGDFCGWGSGNRSTDCALLMPQKVRQLQPLWVVAAIKISTFLYVDLLQVSADDRERLFSFIALMSLSPQQKKRGEEVFDALIVSLALTKTGEVYHTFDNGGFTASVCLTESHVSIHTWPEYNLATFDVFLSNFRNDNSDKIDVMSQKGMGEIMATTASVNCPTCGTGINVYDSGNSIYFGCTNCNTFFTNVDGSKSLLISKDLDNGHYPLLVPLEYNGHWMIVDAVDKNNYSFHNKAAFGTSWELRQGEFDWDVLLDTDKLYTEEFVWDQEMIVVETYDRENFDWYRGAHVSDTEIVKGFGVDISELPPKIGIGVLEPNKYLNIWKPFRNFSIFMFLLVVLTHMIMGAVKPPSVVLSETYLVKQDTAAWSTSFLPVKSTSFTIKEDGAVNIDITTDVNNVWLELPVTMVNEKTGEDFEFTKLVEHYTGCWAVEDEMMDEAA